MLISSGDGVSLHIRNGRVLLFYLPSVSILSLQTSNQWRCVQVGFPEELWWFHWFPPGAFQHIWLARPWALLQLGSEFHQSQPSWLNSLYISFTLNHNFFTKTTKSITVGLEKVIVSQGEGWEAGFLPQHTWVMRESVPSPGAAGCYCHPLSTCCCVSAEIVTPRSISRRNQSLTKVQAAEPG